MTTGQFTTENGQLVWKETRVYPLEDVGCVYLCHQSTDMDHEVYKLTKIPGKQRFFWAALWNSCAVTGLPQSKNVNWKYEFDTIEEAIQAKLDSGWQVIRADFNDFFRSGLFSNK